MADKSCPIQCGTLKFTSLECRELVENVRWNKLLDNFYSAIPIACIYARVGTCIIEATPTPIPDS